MSLTNYEEYWLGLDYEASEKPKQIEEYKHPADAVFSLMEELYNTENAINPERIKQAFEFLCNEYCMDKDMLDLGLSVVHWKSKR